MLEYMVLKRFLNPKTGMVVVYGYWNVFKNNYMEGSGSATIKPEDQWSYKRSPDILAQ